ncbi:MAG: CDP-alcohol phosphatidyltransferase family protein [Candidatus Altiarchaeota archaeon]|nr:CDP-alcohol phosphatidyltransferase family protein [Candidatus Altiarchaeota archaeon]
MFKSRFRDQVEWVSVKIGILFSKFGIPANLWTVLALVPAIAGLVLLYYQMVLWAAILFFASGFIDAIDGAVARVTHSVSNLGAFLDGVIDRYVELALYAGLWVFFNSAGIQFPLLPNGLWFVLLVFGAMMPSFVTAYADHKGVVTEPEDHRKMGGLMERSERLDVILIGMVAAHYNSVWLVYAVILVTILCHATVFQRLLYVMNYRR